jgi:hypothetical protein
MSKFSAESSPTATVSVTNQISFTDSPAAGTVKTFAAKHVGSAMDGLQLIIADTTTPIDKLWLLERYTLP